MLDDVRDIFKALLIGFLLALLQTLLFSLKYVLLLFLVGILVISVRMFLFDDGGLITISL